jgi:putative Mg2+ transporter-C (MgtC) family protein
MLELKMIERPTTKGLVHTPTFAQVLVATGARTIHTSGQVSIDEEGKLVGAGDLAAQTTQAMKNLGLPLEAAGATFADIVKTNSERAAEVREKLAETLEKASYPIRETKVIYRSDDNVEVAAELVTLAAEPDELDGVVAALAALPGVSHAAWNVSAME